MGIDARVSAEGANPLEGNPIDARVSAEDTTATSTVPICGNNPKASSSNQPATRFFRFIFFDLQGSGEAIFIHKHG